MRKRCWLTLLSLLLAVPAVFAQAITYDDQVDFYAPTATGETGLFTGIVGETLRQGDWSFSIYYNDYDYLLAPAREFSLAGTPLSRRTYRDMDVDDNRLSVSLGYGLTDRWEIVASIPYVMIENNAGDLAGFLGGRLRVGKFDDSGLGKLHIGTKFGLFDPATTDSRMALSLFADFPTGDEELVGDGTDFGVGLHWNSGIWSIGAQYEMVGDTDEDEEENIVTIEMPNEIRIDLGANVPVGFWPTTNWITELNTVFYTGGDREPDNPIYLVTGLRHWFGTSGWALNAGLRYNITMATSDNNSCPIGGLLGLTFAPLLLAPPPPPPPLPPPPPPEIVAPVPPPPPPPVVPPPAPRVREDVINFEPGSARLTNIAKAILDDVALRLRQEPDATVEITGFTDNRENTGPNRDLDRRRAEAARDYLVSRHGIDPARITVRAGGVGTFGDNATAEGRLQNRRVVIRMVIPEESLLHGIHWSAPAATPGRFSLAMSDEDE